MTVVIPELFEKKLLGQDRERGMVYTALASFGAWFKTSGTPFFRDYTDHSTEHISNVLATAAAMIPKKSEDSFSRADTTVFVLATLLHDAALHLTKPGFHHLIFGEACDRRIDYFDEYTWETLWDEFLFAARRWDDRKLTVVFGSEFVQKGHAVSNPFDRWDDLSEADYKFIGEFIRRHHARLAHEFAKFGVPGVSSDALVLPAEVPEEWRDLTGVIARSHGLPLRKCWDYLARKPYNKREYQDIHAVYLMALLRLADYLQVDASRAPKVVFRFRILPSVDSDLEWRAHHAVENITPLHDDPESVEIDAQPRDVQTYLRVRDWIAGIQSELDISWAVLGEVYGRFPEVSLHLQWRRVRSNLDDVGAFGASVSYLPRHIRLEVARAEMLSLLIRPLYGDDPAYGVRELIQNAVDAVREREYFQRRHEGRSFPPLREQKADVVVWISGLDANQGAAWLEVSDRGIGMTDSTLIAYFLTAGASYRHSDQWQRTFERADLPPDATKPRAQILRSGRFGVGALAAFLLGDEIYVETRHITSPVGYRFTTSLTQEAIQIQRTADLAVGTRIRIPFSAVSLEKIQGDLRRRRNLVAKPGQLQWYVLDHPIIQILIGDNKDPLETKQTSLNLRDWRIAETKMPIEIHWSFDSEGPELSCNGIFVSCSSRLPNIQSKHCNSRYLRVHTPKLHITDPDGLLPLDLTRKEIVGEYGFERDLYISVIKDFLARVFAKFPESFAASAIVDILDSFPVEPPEYGYTVSDKLDCLLSVEGFCIPCQNSFRVSPNPLRHILWLTSVEELKLTPDLASWDCVILDRKFTLSDIREKCFESLGRKLMGKFCRTNSKTVRDEISGQMDTSSFRENWVTWEDKEYSYQTRKSKKVTKSTRWLVSSLDMGESCFPFNSLLEAHRENPTAIPFAAEVVLAEPLREKVSAHLIDQLWRQLFGDEWIPWKKVDRYSKFPRACQVLAPYLAHYDK